jgi:Histidine phosphatase superfamily (branch 1)
MAEVITRVGAAMERLAEEHAGREVVIVSHGGAIRGAIAHALRIGPDNALHMSIQNLSLSRLQRTPDGWRVVCVNLSRTSRNQKGTMIPRLCGQIWMIRRFTSARFFPQSAGASKRTIRVQAIRPTQDGTTVCSIATVFCRKHQESGDKGLMDDLATLTRNTVCFGGAKMLIVHATPTPVQRRAFSLLEVELAAA